MTDQSILSFGQHKYLKQTTLKTQKIDTVDANYYEKTKPKTEFR